MEPTSPVHGLELLVLYPPLSPWKTRVLERQSFDSVTKLDLKKFGVQHIEMKKLRQQSSL
jgi:hypothetical protein